MVMMFQNLVESMRQSSYRSNSIVASRSGTARAEKIASRLGFAAARPRTDAPRRANDEGAGAGSKTSKRLGGAGAQERTRTFTAVKPLAPEASASTNSATWARAG